MKHRVLMKMIQAPCPPTIPTANSITVVSPSVCLLDVSIKAAKMWATVKNAPPIIIVFFTPYLEYNFAGNTPNKTLALTAKLN
jgi:hypothetical protein